MLALVDRATAQRSLSQSLTRDYPRIRDAFLDAMLVKVRVCVGYVHATNLAPGAG